MEEQLTYSVTDLKSFPFSSFNEFREAWHDNKIRVSINTVTTYELAKVRSLIPWKLMVFMLPLPYLLVPLFAFLLHNWWFLLALPLPFIGNFLFHPSANKILKNFRLLSYLLLYPALIISPFMGLWWITAIAIIALYMHWYHEFSFGICRFYAEEVLRSNEGILCRIWLSGNIFIKDNQGNFYFPQEQ